MNYAHDDQIWQDDYPGEPPAKKVRRIRASTGMTVQEIADRMGLNRIGPANDNPREQSSQQDAQHTQQQAQHAQEEKFRRESEEKFREAEAWHAEWEARREKVNGKAGRGNPKIDRMRLFTLRAAGLGVRAIARELGCSHVAVMKILRGAGNH